MRLVCTEDFDYSSHTVLVVDNNPDNLDTFLSYLASCGFQVLIADNGRAALELAKSHMPDLILIDVMLPDIDGFETCRALKENSGTRQIIVVFMTQLNETDNKVKGFEAGAVDYIIKPFEQEELLARVTTHLKLKDLTENFESIVQDKTRELIDANKNLRREIEQKDRMATELTESERRYRSVIENSNDGICVVESGSIGFFNKRLLQILKYENGEELLGKHVTTLFHEDEKERIIKYNKNREAGLPAPERYEAKGITKDGHSVDFGVSATRITYHNKMAVLVFFEDLTSQKKIADQLQQAQKMEAIGFLAGGVAHDFNNILGIIMGYTEMAMLNSGVQGESQAYLNRVMKASKRASDLVNQILSFSRQEGMNPEPLNLSIMVKETLKMLRATMPSTIEICPEVKDSEGFILADPTQIQQVIMNLCTNALHAMPDQGGALHVMLDRVDINSTEILNLPCGSYLKLSIADNGHGMDKDTLSRMFDPYFTTKKTGEGTGLGLALVKKIISSYSGAIKVESVIGLGSRFDIYLPVTKNPEKKDRLEYCFDELPRGSEHILFVDDEEMVVAMYQEILSDLGYKITATESSQDAWQMFEAEPYKFDLVITDLTMPKITGVELSRRMLDVRPQIPIILCSGYSESMTENEARRIGISHYLTKPIVIDRLAFFIRKCLDAKKVC